MSHTSPQPELPAKPDRSADDSAELASHSQAASGLKSRPWHLAAAGALAAGMIWFLVMPSYPFLNYLHQGTMFAPDPGETEIVARNAQANPALLFATIASACSVAFAITEGLARRSFKFAALGSITGLLVSGSVGALGGWLGQCAFEMPLDRLIDLAKSVVVQATCWSVAGFGIGLGFALPARRGRVIGLAAAGALAGGLLAAFLYGPTSAIIFQMANTEDLIPRKPLERLLWLETAAILVGFAAGGLSRPSKA